MTGKIHELHILFPHLTRCGRIAKRNRIVKKGEIVNCALCRKGLTWQQVKR